MAAIELEDIKANVAKRISGLPPEVQADVISIVINCFNAGYKSCQEAYREAGDAMKRGIYGVR
jgi:hypothetical protein